MIYRNATLDDQKMLKRLEKRRAIAIKRFPRQLANFFPCFVDALPLLVSKISPDSFFPHTWLRISSSDHKKHETGNFISTMFVRKLGGRAAMAAAKEVKN